ncbi:MAG: SIMPL domain-containing protein [Acidimicrobiia bacterium]|nr:SIMPL domain-containing protein [Acidimicrobiia bacterium]MDH4308199.1 SIMPL domain-containing protein [Acidimicrobiia bacterium]MDH5295021.1 SIMPL domain-containing protein [Acidimicrobiia bacterium]
MGKRTLILATALIVAACGTTVAASTGESTQMSNTIAVSGTGDVMGVPDTLVVDLGVSVLEPTVSAATAKAAQLAEGMLKALSAAGVDEKDIQTANYSIYPEYDYSQSAQRLLGYRVMNTVSVKVREVERAGDVIDAATKAGGESAVVNGIRFDIEDDGELVTAAREAAWADAKAKAEQLADLAGVALGQAVKITETFSPAPSQALYARAELAADGGGTPIQPGEQQVSVTVTVEFQIG